MHDLVISSTTAVPEATIWVIVWWNRNWKRI